ncbi:MAG TPA: hypothetical protein DCM87_09490 [Planctomycetes bacterium]|nr:hypothetical protein [Planctomycetota bacterium]
MPEEHGDTGALAATLRAFVRGELRLPAEKLKENLMRTVWKVATPTHGSVLVKHYRYVRAFDRARYLVLPDKARSECRNLTRLGARGAPVPRGYLWERWGRREAMFAGEFLEGAEPWPAAPSEALVRKLAAAVRTLHDARFSHGDLHLGNVLVRGGDVYLIDFHGGRFLPYVPRRVETVLLGMLAASLQGRGQGGLVEPLLAAYAGREDPALLERVRAAAARHGVRRRASRRRRCLIDSTRYAVERRGALRVYRLRAVPWETIEALLGAPAQGRRGGADVIEHEGRRFLRASAAYDPAGGARARLAGGRLLRAWCALHALGLLGIDVAAGIACVERRAFGLVRGETLIAAPGAAAFPDARGLPGASGILGLAELRELLEGAPPAHGQQVS